MLNQAIAFVLDALFHLFILAALVRFWMQALRAPARNPIAQFTLALTNWAVRPLRRVIPGFFSLDLATLFIMKSVARSRLKNPGITRLNGLTAQLVSARVNCAIGLRAGARNACIQKRTSAAKMNR